MKRIFSTIFILFFSICTLVAGGLLLTEETGSQITEEQEVENDSLDRYYYYSWTYSTSYNIYSSLYLTRFEGMTRKSSPSSTYVEKLGTVFEWTNRSWYGAYTDYSGYNLGIVTTISSIPTFSSSSYVAVGGFFPESYSYNDTNVIPMVIDANGTILMSANQYYRKYGSSSLNFAYVNGSILNKPFAVNWYYIDEDGRAVSALQNGLRNTRYIVPTANDWAIYSSNGWTFLGWSTSAGSTWEEASTSFSTSFATSRYGVYDRDVTLYFMPGTGTGSTTSRKYHQRGELYSRTYNYFSITIIANPSFTKKGYSFNGWSTSYSSTTGTYAASTTYDFTEFFPNYGSSNSRSLYAAWTPNNYTLTFNANGGSCSTSSKLITFNTVYGELPTPTRTGYEFAGWYTAASGGTKVSASTKMTSEGTTVYAHWTPNMYTATLDVNGGEYSAEGYNSTTEWNFTGSNCVNLGRSYMYEDKIYISAEAYMDDWSKYADSDYMRILSCTEGGGWNIEGYGDRFRFSLFDKGYGYVAAVSDVPCTSLSSGWHKFEASFDGQRGYLYLDGTLVAISSVLKSGKIEYCPTNSIFVGAEAGGDPTNPVGYFVGKVRNVKILHAYKAKTTFYNSPYDTLLTPTRTNYTFNGWYTASSGGAQITSSSTYTTLGNQTLYAHWVPTPITVGVKLWAISKDGTSVSASNAGGSVNVTRAVISGSTSTQQTTNQTTQSASYTVHQGQYFEIVPVLNDGYIFAGCSSSGSVSNAIKNPQKPLVKSYDNPSSDKTYNFYFKQVSGNRLKYDSTDKYFYFEDGYYPQSEATNPSTLYSSASATGETLTYNNGETDVTIPVYSHGTDRYVKVKGKQKSSVEWTATGSNYYYIEKSKAYTDKLTVNLWAYKDNWNISGQQTLISWTNSGGWNLYINPGAAKGYLGSEIMKAGTSEYTTIKYGALSSISSGWHMFTLIFDGRYVRSYRDGNLIETVDWGVNSTIKPEALGNDIVVGAECGYNHNNTPDGLNLVGKIKGVEIKHTGLTAQNVKDLYQTGTYEAWFKFEPIRWRISDYGVANTERNIARYTTLCKLANYTSYTTNFTAVSDLILSVGAMHNTRNVGAGFSVQDMASYQNIQNTTDGVNITFNHKANTSIIVDKYSTASNNNIITKTSVNYTAPLRIASLQEIKSVGLVNKGARASDMVAFLLGVDKNKVSYWTRDLSNLGSGVAITSGGTVVQPWLNQMLGIRFAYTFSEASNVGLYNELEYIQSTGTQWIDTGWATTNGMVCEFSAE